MRTPEAEPDSHRPAHAELLCANHAPAGAIDSGPCVPRATHEALQKNYRALFHDYATALAWLNRLNGERTEVDGLAGWAIIAGDDVHLTNHAFDRLERRSQRGQGWREMICTVPSPVHVGPSFPTLRGLALAQATSVCESRRCVRTRRFHRGPSFIELSIERTPNERGEITTFVVVHDVAALVEMERRLGVLERYAVQQDHMRKIGELSMGVAHDLQNLLGALACRLAAFELTHAIGDADAKSLHEIHAILGSGHSLVATLHAAAHPAAPEPAAVDLESVVASAIEMAESTFEVAPSGNGAMAVRVEFPALPEVWGSADDLRNVFLHLLLHARKSMPNGGAVGLRAEVLADAVIVRVQDEGAGNETDLVEPIFDPLFGARRIEDGVGLALARQTMLRVGGDITATARRDGGTCFELRFAVPMPPSPFGAAENLDLPRPGISANDP